MAAQTWITCLFDRSIIIVSKVPIVARLPTQVRDELVLAMSAKLESIIAAEIGVDDGRELPDVEGVDWALPQERYD